MTNHTDLITIPTIEDVTRRTFITGALASALLIACGDSDDEADPTPEAATRLIDTDLGQVEVPTRPQRVAVWDRRGTLAYLLDLGITPVISWSAASIYGSKFHPLLQGTDKVQAIDWQSPDLEALAAATPDLIVGYKTDVEKVHDQLKAIAPTVAYTYDFDSPQNNLTELGRVLGMQEKAAKLLSDFEADVAAAKAKVKASGTASVILPLEGSVRVYRGVDMASQLIKSLGFTIVPDISTLGAAADADIIPISYEQVSALNADVLVVLVNLSSDQDAIKKQLYDQAVFKTLPAVRNNRIVEIESQANFGTAGLRGQRQILDALVKGLA